MFGEVMNLILEAMERKYGVSGYIDEEGGLIVPSMIRAVWDKCQMREKTIVFPRSAWGDSIWCRALREKTMLHSNRPSAVPEGHIAITRNISLPIVFRGDVIGLLQVANKEKDYDSKDTALLQHLADSIAPVLSARLQRDREEKGRQPGCGPASRPE
jgi:GAF domain-containing protein